ncbi:hypothetical protein ACFQO4_20765 [Saliphagus sp. GCM10025334]
MSETECAVCGAEERPEKGWIYKSGDVQPVEIEGGELRFEAKEGALAYCSTECSRQAEDDDDE